MDPVRLDRLFRDAWADAERDERDHRDRPLVEAARDDVNAFAEYAFVDDDGIRLTQADHHRLFQDLFRTHLNLVMHFPVEHGKTTQTKILLVWLLGRYPGRQYAYVSSKGLQAQKLVAAVAREITDNPLVLKVFPHLKPEIGTVRHQPAAWGGTGIRVEGAPPGAKDMSLAAYGVDGAILGSRLHGVIVDNSLDRDNTASAVMRKKILQLLEDEAFTRPHPGGFRLLIDTAWHDDDALHIMAGRAGWHHEKFDATVSLTDKVSLWPEKFPLDRLDRIRARTATLSFDRMYRNKPLSESTAYFKREFWDASYARCLWLESWPDGFDLQCDLRTGLDLAVGEEAKHDLTVASTVLARGHRRQLIHMESGRKQTVAIMQMIIRIFRLLHAPINRAGGNAIFVVEDNAAQKYLLHTLQNAAILQALGLTQEEVGHIRVIGRTTTSNKRDRKLGIPGLAADIEMGRWDFAAHHETRELREEMRVWSPGDHAGDRLMATWIAGATLAGAGTGGRVEFVS